MHHSRSRTKPKSQVTPPSLSAKVWKEQLRVACRQNRLRRRHSHSNAPVHAVDWNEILQEELQQNDITVIANHPFVASPMLMCSPGTMGSVRTTPLSSKMDTSMLEDAIPMSLDEEEEDDAASVMIHANQQQHFCITEDEMYQLLLELEQEDDESNDWETQYEAWQRSEVESIQEQIRDYELWQDAKEHRNG
jgi:hypothetical protein